MPPAHGGDSSLAGQWPDAPRPILDLSTGINPFAYPVDDVPASAWQRLPQNEAEERLRGALAAYLGLADADMLVLAPGSQILINQLPFLFDPGRVSVVGPTYGEHIHCWARAGHRVTEVDTLDRTEGVTVVTNPNNPDGRRIARDTLIAHARDGGLLIVDEAFADLAPEISVADLVAELPIVVLRSFGKSFGLAGLRLGALAAAPEICARMRARLGPWPVSGPALEVAARAYDDAEWIAATRARLKQEAARLDALLTGSGLDVIGGTDLFRLASRAEAGSVYDGLGARGILVRRFEAQPAWLRFGLPPGETAYTRLASALKEILSDV